MIFYITLKLVFCFYYQLINNVNLIEDNYKIRVASQRVKSDSVATFSAISDSADAQNVSCLGLCEKAMLNMDWVLSIIRSQYLYSK